MERPSAVLEPVRQGARLQGAMPADEPPVAQAQSAARQRGAEAQALLEDERRPLREQARLAQESRQSSAARPVPTGQQYAEWPLEARARQLRA